MATGVREITECRVCGARDWSDVTSFGTVPLANAYRDPAAEEEDEASYPLEVVVCRSCRLMCLRHVVDPEVLFRDYSYVTPDSTLMARHMRQVADSCAGHLAARDGGLVVELGSNTGSQLELFRDRGMRTLGVDPAVNLARVAERRGIPTLSEFFSSKVAGGIAASHGRAELILGRHVFAHVDDLADLLAGVRVLLSPEGVFAVEVPYLLDLIDGNAFDTIYHEHLSYFSVGTLGRLFSRHGMRILDVERVGVHGGSILVFAGVAEGCETPAPAVTRLMAEETRAGLGDPGTYRRFAERVDRTRHSLGDLLRRLAAEGRVIAGYGAPAKAGTLLNACGIGAREIAYCTDTTSLKQHKLLPGSHIPILPPNDGDRPDPDYYVLFAWNYAQEILEKEQRYLHDGGHFIVPVPEPSIVTAQASVPGR